MNLSSWSTKNKLILIVYSSVLLLCLSQFFVFSAAFSFLDNEELYLKSRLGDDLFSYIHDNLPYVISGLVNFWVSDALIDSNSLLKFRFASMLTGSAAMIGAIILVIKFGAGKITGLVVSLMLAFSFQVQIYSHWGITGYIAAILYSIVALSFFYAEIDRMDGSFASRSVVCFALAVGFLFSHADLIIMLLACSALVALKWFFSLVKQNTIPKSLIKVCYLTLPYWIFPVSLVIFLASIPDSTRDIGVRAHQTHLFFRTSVEHSGVMGFVSFYWDSWYDFFRRTLISDVIPRGWERVFVNGSALSILVGSIIALGSKGDPIARSLLFLTAYALLVVIGLSLLNLMNLHQIGLPRYALYLIVPVYLLIALSGALILNFLWRATNRFVLSIESKGITSALSCIRSNADLISVLLIGGVAINFFTSSMESRLSALELNQDTQQLLTGPADIVAIDDRFVGIYRLQYVSPGTPLERIGSGTPNRPKNLPSEAFLSTVQDQNASILAVTAFVPLTTTGTESEWGYNGYEFLSDSHCQVSSIKNRRLLVELWRRCEP